MREALFKSDQFESEPSAGRGNIYRFPLGDQQGIVREYQRGGAIQHILKNGYILDNRPLRELKIWCAAHEQGVPVPNPLGVTWHKRGPLYYGAIATQYTQSQHLQTYLESKPSLEARTNVLTQVGKAIRTMHETNIMHMDLQVRNILILPNGSPNLIDFDSAKQNPPISDQDRYRNLLRLKCSFEKNALALNDFAILCNSYGVANLPKALSLLYAIKRKASNAMSKSGKS